MGENVRSAERIFDLLEILAEQRGFISLTELAELTSLSKTTVHRLMQTLVSREYAEKTENAKYFLGPKIIELASYHIEHLELHNIARPYLAELYSEYNLTVNLGKVVQDKVVYIEIVDNMRLWGESPGGIGVPVYPTAIGKCLLASLSGNELDEMLYRHPLAKYTSKTITDAAEYKRHLKQVRANGWALDDEEFLLGRRAVGAPVYDFTGMALASISIRGNVSEITDERLPVLRDAVMRTAAAISRRMGYLP